MGESCFFEVEAGPTVASHDRGRAHSTEGVWSLPNPAAPEFSWDSCAVQTVGVACIIEDLVLSSLACHGGEHEHGGVLEFGAEHVDLWCERFKSCN